MEKAFIEFKNIFKIFQSGNSSEQHALKDISFKISKGDIYGIVGMSGAGKSTLLRCLAGLEKPTSGALFIKDNNIGGMSNADLRLYRRNLGIIFQHFNLLPSRTAAENIRFPMEIHGINPSLHAARIDELLDIVSLSHKRDSYPTQLSGGEKQRIGIARALANNPEILLCDEPTSALDAASTQNILKLLKQLNSKLGLTIILITHQLDVVQQICNKVAVLSNGELIEEGLVSEIFYNPKQEATRQLFNSGKGRPVLYQQEAS